MTWATHMRDPASLLRDLGPIGFVSFNVILLGALNSFLAAPVFALLWLAHFFILDIPTNVIPSVIWWMFSILMIAGQVVMFTEMLATTHKHLRHLIPYILTLPLYWPLGMLASYKTLAELVYAPFYWDKTHHGRNEND